MDGLHNVTAIQFNTLEHAGKTYKLAVLGLNGYAEKEAYIIAHKPSPLAIMNDLPPLPEPPRLPIPPDVTEVDKRQEYGKQLEMYYAAKRSYDDALASRLRMEEGLRKDSQAPRFVSFEEEARFDASLHGIGWRLWRALRGNHPEIDSVQAALNLIHELGPGRFQEVISKLDVAEEKELLGKSGGSKEALQEAVASPGL